MIRALGTGLVLLVLLVTGLLTAPPQVRSATPAPPQVLDDAPRFVELTVDTVTPSTVTSTATAVAVRGSVRNIGDRRVEDVVVRLQRGPAVATTTELGSALRATPTVFEAIGAFVEVSPGLDPGQSTEFSLAMPATGVGSLQITEPGVYPVLVNVNGSPDFGDQARLDSGHFLLPVRSVPAPVGEPARAAPSPTDPPPVSVLWPLADEPRLLPADGQGTVLSDDVLATSFAAGGRLRGLLDTVRTATSPEQDPDGDLAAATCLALDPDLVVTAELMAAGYQVQTGGQRFVGTGSDAAAVWLDDLRAMATSTCVLAWPWAQADVNALARADLGDLQSAAIGAGSAALERVLGVAPQPGVVLPSRGLLTREAAQDMVDLGATGTVLSAAAVAGAPGTGRARISTAADGVLDAALVDASTAAALRESSAADAQQPLRVQDLVGALSWPALAPGTARSPEVADRPAAVLLAPPPDWQVDAAQAATVLTTVADLVAEDRLTPTGLPALLEPSGAPTVELAYPVDGAVQEAATTAVVDADRRLRAFDDATETDPQSGVDPEALLTPLRRDLLRAVSTAETDADRAAIVAERLTQLFERVSLQAPGGVYTLASEESPLLLVVRNDLPVAIGVRLLVSGPPGLSATDIGVQSLPAGSATQLQVPTTIARTGQFSVDVALTTGDGQPLGDATRLQVRSTAYGPATAAVTGVAGALLVVLVGRRLVHRFRNQPDRADDGRPQP